MPRGASDDVKQDKATLARIAVSRERNKLRTLGFDPAANWLSYYLTDANEASLARLFEYFDEARKEGGLDG